MKLTTSAARAALIAGGTLLWAHPAAALQLVEQRIQVGSDGRLHFIGAVLDAEAAVV